MEMLNFNQSKPKLRSAFSTYLWAANRHESEVHKSFVSTTLKAVI